MHEVDGDEDLLGTCIYPDGNQQKTLTETETETTGPDAQTTTQRYAYHKAGNTIRPGDTAEQHLTWNAEGPAAGLDESGGRTYRPLRDPRRRRRRRVTGPPSANLTV